MYMVSGEKNQFGIACTWSLGKNQFGIACTWSLGKKSVWYCMYMVSGGGGISLVLHEHGLWGGGISLVLHVHGL